MKTSILDAEVGGAYFGIAGALVLALAVPASKWGWLLFLGSNVCWLTFAYRQRFRKLYWQTVVYTGSSLLGIANAFWAGNSVQAFLTGLLG